jgi:hypothetical protein
VVETRSGKDDLTAHAAHLQDPAAALRAEVREHCPGQLDRRAKVRVELAIDLGV